MDDPQVFDDLDAADIALTLQLAMVLAPPFCKLVEFDGDDRNDLVRKRLNEHGGSVGWVDVRKPFADVWHDMQNVVSLDERRQGWTSSEGVTVPADVWDFDEPHLSQHDEGASLREVMETAALYVAGTGLQSASPHNGQAGAYYQCCYEVASDPNDTQEGNDYLVRKSKRRMDALRKILAAAALL